MGIDLGIGKLVKGRAQWMHLTDYNACQTLADVARAADIEVIRYISVRDPKRGSNVALLTHKAFTKTKPASQQTWHIRLSSTGAQAICESPKTGITFDQAVFAADPRVAHLRWRRD